MNILYGIQAVKLDSWSDIHEENLIHSLDWLREKQLFTLLDKVVVVTDLEKADHEIPVMEILSLGDILSGT